MKTELRRLISVAFAVAALVAVMPLSENGALYAQDITITIKKEKKEKEDKPDLTAEAPFKGKRPAVDVAVLLDTSNSMDGLISQAKSQLWNIVQEFAAAKKSGQTPSLRVSVFEYGNTKLPASEGYIRQVVSLTDDLDSVSEALFSLKTSGGDEYCGMVIDESLKRLDWSEEENAYKVIFIAGNEPFTQGSVEYRKACKKAIQSGVVVNTIHCGDFSKGVHGRWQDAANIAEGEYMNINQDIAVVHYKTPHDKVIIELNNELNKTYLWFGSSTQRKRWTDNQYLQDSNAWKSGSYGGRGGAKVSGVYDNTSRDLVDNLKTNGPTEGKRLEILKGIKKEALPEKLQKMNEKERLAYVEEMMKKRSEIQKKIVAENVARGKFVAEKQKESAKSGEATLGSAVTSAVRKQLVKKGFNLNNN